MPCTKCKSSENVRWRNKQNRLYCDNCIEGVEVTLRPNLCMWEGKCCEPGIKSLKTDWNTIYCPQHAPVGAITRKCKSPCGCGQDVYDHNATDENGEKITACTTCRGKQVDQKAWASFVAECEALEIKVETTFDEYKAQQPTKAKVWLICSEGHRLEYARSNANRRLREVADGTLDGFCIGCNPAQRDCAKESKLEELRKIVEANGCTLLADTYYSMKKLPFRCRCGEESEAIAANLKRGTLCASCGRDAQVVSSNATKAAKRAKITCLFEEDGVRCSATPVLCYGKKTHCEDHCYLVPKTFGIKCKTCETEAHFGLEGGPPEYCRGCSRKLGPQYVNVRSPRCEHVDEKGNRDCKIQPTFGLPEQKATRCFAHKEDGMEAVRGAKCVVCNKAQPNYGVEGGTVTHCGTCAKSLPGMVRIYAHLCSECPGRKEAVFNYPDCTTNWKCAKHQKVGMKNLKGVMCAVCGTSQGHYFYEGKWYCSNDVPDYENAKCNLPKCTECHLRFSATDYGLCRGCYRKKNPETKQIQVGLKELEVGKYLRQKYPKQWIHNSQIRGQVVEPCQSVCRARPDYLLHMPTYAIIVEVDENQHAHHEHYIPESQFVRDFSMMKALRKPVIVIRFNTDMYRRNGITTYSPFTHGANAKKVLPHTPEQIADWKSRLATLSRVVDMALQSDIEEGIIRYYLYYDDVRQPDLPGEVIY